MSYLRALEFRLSCRSVYEKVGVEFEDATNLLKNRSIFNVDCIDDLTRIANKDMTRSDMRMHQVHLCECDVD